MLNSTPDVSVSISLLPIAMVVSFCVYIKYNPNMKKITKPDPFSSLRDGVMLILEKN